MKNKEDEVEKEEIVEGDDDVDKVVKNPWEFICCVYFKNKEIKWKKKKWNIGTK